MKVQVVALRPFPLPTGALAQPGEVYVVEDSWAAMFASRLIVDPRKRMKARPKKKKEPASNKKLKPKEDK
jgi:hypothetical protein